MMTPRQIEAFRAVMVTGTVTQAAGMLYVSQPAVSRMISDLENETGFKLFTRAKRQLIPTEEGRALFDEVERVFVGLDQIVRAAESIREFRRDHFRLITIPSLASTIMADLVSRVAEQYPAVSISLEVQPSQRMFKWIVSQQCDIGLSTLPADDAAIESRPVAQGRSVCILPAGHDLARKKKIRPRNLEDLPFISFKADSFSRHIVDEVFRAAGVRRKLHIEARTMEAISGLVAAGLGVSVIGPVFHDGGFHQDIVIRPFEPSIPVELTLLYPAHKPLSRMAGLFIEIVDDYVATRPGMSPRQRRGNRG